MSQWRPKITPAVGGVAKAKAKAKAKVKSFEQLQKEAQASALRQEFQDNQEHWRRRIAEKGPEDEIRAEIASRWQQWSIDHPGTQTAKLEKLKADGSHKQRGNVWFNTGDNPMQATLSLRKRRRHEQHDCHFGDPSASRWQRWLQKLPLFGRQGELSVLSG